MAQARCLWPLALAFVLGALVAALLLPAFQNGANTHVAPAADAETQNVSEPLDLAKTFPSWNQDSESLASLVAFVQDVTDPTSPNYKEPAERIATFDMDGTIISEKAPIYLDHMLLIHRVLDDPTHQASADTVQLMEEIRDLAMSGERVSDYAAGKAYAIAHEFAGMTPDEFRAYVRDFLDTEPVVGFDGMTYGQSLYQPMLEVIRYLQANEFDVWMVSACEREYGSAEKSAEQYELVGKESWTAFSMRDDWATIYGEGVTKTELPGLAEVELAEAA